MSEDIDHPDIARHCARAIQFVRSQSKDQQIDAEHIVCGGASAGAIISEYLAYHDDYAILESDDEVSRMSSRPNAVVSLWQPSLDLSVDFCQKYFDGTSAGDAQ